MKIAFEISELSKSLHSINKKTGIYRYIYQIGQLLAQNLTHNLLLFTGDLDDNLEVINQYLSQHPILKSAGFLQSAHTSSPYPEADIIHYPLETLARPFLKSKPLIFQTIHDTIPCMYPELYTKKRAHVVINLCKRLSKFDRIFCPSISTKQDLLTFSQLDPDKIFVIHHAACPHIFYPSISEEPFNLIKKKYHLLDNPYLLCVGRLEERKNISHILQTFIRLIDEEKIDDLNLVLVGPLNTLSHPVIYTFTNEVIKKGFQNRVIHIPFLEDEWMATLYSHALISLFLPIYEGFGLPALEAMQCGSPLICSNNSSIPEIVADAGILIDHDDADLLCHNILDLYHSDTKRSYYRKKGLERSKLFNWKKYVEQAIVAYQFALENTP